MQVSHIVQTLKHKLRPNRAYFKAVDFDPIIFASQEELHQRLIGLYGEHLLPVTMYEIEKTLHNPDTISCYDNKGDIISKARLKNMYAILRNSLSLVESNTSTI
jgi:hypothetical protein